MKISRPQVEKSMSSSAHYLYISELHTLHLGGLQPLDKEDDKSSIFKKRER